jgi:putative copper export protein
MPLARTLLWSLPCAALWLAVGLMAAASLASDWLGPAWRHGYILGRRERRRLALVALLWPLALAWSWLVAPALDLVGSLAIRGGEELIRFEERHLPADELA